MKEIGDPTSSLVVLIGWLVFLIAAIWLTNRKNGHLGAVAHLLSGYSLACVLASAGMIMGWTFQTLGWWIWAIILGGAVLLNLMLIWIAGQIWPHCQACGHGQLNEIQTGDNGLKEVCARCQTPKGER